MQIPYLARQSRRLKGPFRLTASFSLLSMLLCSVVDRQSKAKRSNSIFPLTT